MRLLGPAQREAEPDLDDLTGRRRARPEEAEGAQRRRPDVREVQAGAARHEAAVVPEHLPPRVRVALEVDGERRALDDDLPGRRPGAQRREVGAERDGRAVRDRQAAEREVDDEARVRVRGEGVAVDRALGADRDLAPDPVAERGGVVAGGGLLVEQVPVPAERVERLEHGRHPHVVVVLADRARAGLLEVREARRDRVVEQRGRYALGAEVVPAVPRGVGARVGARRDHPERMGGSGVGVAHERLGGPPRRGEAGRRREIGHTRAHERVHVLEHAHLPPGRTATRPAPDGTSGVCRECFLRFPARHDAGTRSGGRGCPGWDSNPHWIGFEPNASAGWATGAVRGGAGHRVRSACTIEPHVPAFTRITLLRGRNAGAAGGTAHYSEPRE